MADAGDGAMGAPGARPHHMMTAFPVNSSYDFVAVGVAGRCAQEAVPPGRIKAR